MKRYDIEGSYEPYTGQHQGTVGIESDMGDWCKAEDLLELRKQRDQLREALEEGEHWTKAYVDQMASYVISDDAKEALGRIRAALKETSE